MMEKDSKIYVAGHRGMVGSAIVRELERQGYTNIVTRTHSELDLKRQSDVEEFFRQEKPEYVFLAAAKVGGIVANESALADFMYDNMILEMNVIHSAWENNWIILYLSKIGATANEGELLADIGIGKNERGICFGKDFWSEIL